MPNKILDQLNENNILKYCTASACKAHTVHVHVPTEMLRSIYQNMRGNVHVLNSKKILMQLFATTTTIRQTDNVIVIQMKK